MASVSSCCYPGGGEFNVFDRGSRKRCRHRKFGLPLFSRPLSAQGNSDGEEEVMHLHFPLFTNSVWDSCDTGHCAVRGYQDSLSTGVQGSQLTKVCRTTKVRNTEAQLRRMVAAWRSCLSHRIPFQCEMNLCMSPATQQPRPQLSCSLLQKLPRCIG